ncbi:MAG: biotin/lipoate--protein ligase family protein, partial [Parvibaculum sp.]
LETEQPLATARRILYAGMVAIAEALMPAPGTGRIILEWPHVILRDGCRIATGRLAWPEGFEDDEVPDWLVFGGTVRTSTRHEKSAQLPATHARRDAEADDAGAQRFLEAFTRRFLAALATWDEGGFEALARIYLRYLPIENGERCEIGPTGDLLLYGAAGDVLRFDLAGRLSGP